MASRQFFIVVMFFWLFDNALPFRIVDFTCVFPGRWRGIWVLNLRAVVSNLVLCALNESEKCLVS